MRMSILLVLSTVIATAGLLSDSAAVVIGAMLVAPLMSPVMAAAGAVVARRRRRAHGRAGRLVSVARFGRAGASTVGRYRGGRAGGARNLQP